MKKIFYLMAMAIVTVAFTACSDSDDDTSTPDTQNPQDVYEKNSEAGAAMSRLVAHLTAAESLPDNWKTATFEVDYGTAMNAATPTVRYAVVENIDEAALVYSMLVGKSISSTATTDTWSMEGVGSLVWKAVNQPGLFATVDVDVKQLSGLTQIRFVPASAMDENAGFTGTPWYYYGDVVQDKKGDYWICVKIPDATDNQSYWVSFANPYASPETASGNGFKYYNGNDKKGFWYQRLPDNLGAHNYLINMIVLMKSIAHYNYDPDNSENWPAHNSNTTQTQLYRDLYAHYTAKNLWDNLFPGGLQGLLAAFLTQSPSWKVNLFYGGHTYKSNGDITMDRIICSGAMCYPNNFQVDPYKMSANSFAFEPRTNGYPTGWDLSAGAMLYYRCKTGKELSGNIFTIPDPEKPLDGVTDIVLSTQTSPNAPTDRHYAAGDIIQRKSDGAYFLCVRPAGGSVAKNKDEAWFICLNPAKTVKTTTKSPTFYYTTDGSRKHTKQKWTVAENLMSYPVAMAAGRTLSFLLAGTGRKMSQDVNFQKAGFTSQALFSYCNFDVTNLHTDFNYESSGPAVEARLANFCVAFSENDKTLDQRATTWSQYYYEKSFPCQYYTHIIEDEHLDSNGRYLLMTSSLLPIMGEDSYIFRQDLWQSLTDAWDATYYEKITQSTLATYPENYGTDFTFDITEFYFDYDPTTGVSYKSGMDKWKQVSVGTIQGTPVQNNPYGFAWIDESRMWKAVVTTELRLTDTSPFKPSTDFNDIFLSQKVLGSYAFDYWATVGSVTAIPSNGDGIASSLDGMEGSLY